MKRKTARAVSGLFTATLALSALAVSAGSTAAQTSGAVAAPQQRECGDGYVCLWNAQDKRMQSSSKNPNQIPLNGTEWDDSVYYVQNNTPVAYCAWQHNESDPANRGKYTQIDQGGGTDLSKNRLRNQISLVTRGACPTEEGSAL